MATFAVTMVHGAGWDSARQIRDQDGWDDHAAFMDGLVADGFVLLGGPTGDGEGALHLVEAAGEQEIRSRLGEDPWMTAGRLRIGAIERWALWLGTTGHRSGVSTPPDGLPAYRVLTGPDDAAFCGRVSEAIALGYRLHEGPAVTFNGEQVIVAQALTWPGASAAAASPPPAR